MEHAKKMVLVEPRQIEKLKETMLDKTLSKLDGEIYEILHRNMADDEKAKLYSNSLGRYLNIDKPSVITKFDSKPVDTIEPKSETVKDSKNVESIVLETVPKRWKALRPDTDERCYMDVLQDLVNSYNNTYHRSIGMSPSQVSIENEDIVRKRLYVEKKRPPIWKYDVGDKVRISKARIAFKKGYLPSWTDEIFTIVARIPSDPITYELSDLNDVKIKGKFYQEELQRITKEDDIYKIEKVLKTRKRGRNSEYFVKWKGYDDSFNSWTADIFDA